MPRPVEPSTAGGIFIDGRALLPSPPVVGGVRMVVNPAYPLGGIIAFLRELLEQRDIAVHHQSIFRAWRDAAAFPGGPVVEILQRADVRMHHLPLSSDLTTVQTLWTQRGHQLATRTSSTYKAARAAAEQWAHRRSAAGDAAPTIILVGRPADLAKAPPDPTPLTANRTLRVAVTGLGEATTLSVLDATPPGAYTTTEPLWIPRKVQ